ncbi:hypothetical protein EXE43_21995, partial [Halorubrum sp. SS5]
PARGREVKRLPEYERPEQELTGVEIADSASFGDPIITATGSNDGDFVGGTTVDIFVDGEFESVGNVRLPSKATDETVDLGFSISRIGTFDVSVRKPDGGPELGSGTVTVAPGDIVAEFTDPAGDDDGPGGYTYPTDDAFQDGAFDLRSFRVLETDEEYRFAFEVENLYTGFGGTFSPQYFVVYLRNPSANGGRTTELGDLGVTAEFAEPWQYRVSSDGFGGGKIVDSGGNSFGSPDRFAALNANIAIISVPKSVFGGTDLTDWEVLPVVGSADFGSFRDVQVEAGGFVFGGAKAGAVDNAPGVIDMITPEGTS